MCAAARGLEAQSQGIKSGRGKTFHWEGASVPRRLLGWRMEPNISVVAAMPLAAAGVWTHKP